MCDLFLQLFFRPWHVVVVVPEIEKGNARFVVQNKVAILYAAYPCFTQRNSALRNVIVLLPPSSCALVAGSSRAELGGFNAVGEEVKGKGRRRKEKKKRQKTGSCDLRAG